MDSPPSGGAAGTPQTPHLRSRITRVASASAVAQAVTQSVALLQTIVIARILSPTEVGIFAAGTVLTTLLLDFSEGGLRAALVQRRREVAVAAETVFWGTLATGALASLAALAAAPVIASVFDDRTAGLVAAVSAGGLLLHSLANVPEALLQREFNIARNLVVSPAVSIAFAVVSVTFALLGFGVWSLVIGTYASTLVMLVSVWYLARWRPGRARASMTTWRGLARYGFPLLVDHAGARTRSTAEPVVIGRVLDTAALGFYRYGIRIARLPVDVMIQVVAYALLPAFSHLAEEPDRLRAGYLKALRWITFCAVPVSGLMLAVGEQAAVVVLGEPWRPAGAVLVAMAGLGLGKAFASVSEEALKGCGRTGLINRATALDLVLGLGLLVLVIPFGLTGVGLAISLTALTVGVYCLCLAAPVIGVRGRDVLRATLPMVGAGLVAAAATTALERFVLGSGSHETILAIALLLLDGVAFLIVYLAVLILVAPSMVATLRRGAGGAARKAFAVTTRR